MGGSRRRATLPSSARGRIPRRLHYDKLARKIEDGDIVVMDVGAQYSGYSADITRTIPANGKFTPRQREIYDIVLGAQNAALAAMKPGRTCAVKATKAPIELPTITSIRTGRICMASRWGNILFTGWVTISD